MSDTPPSVTSPAAPTALLKTRRRDSHQRTVESGVRRTSGSGYRTSTRLDIAITSFGYVETVGRAPVW